jgi:serine/threonine protein kinase
VRERSAQDLKRFDPAMVAKGSAFATSVAAGDLDGIVRVGVLRGEGGFGKVFEAVAGGRTVALKKMDHSTEKAVSVNLNEVGCLAELRHKYVVNMERAIVCTPAGATRPQCWILMEFMQGGTLQQASKASKFTTAHVAYVAKSALSALTFMHSRCYAHRDLKSANIMLSIEAEVKLIDFGLCTRIPMPPKAKYDQATEGSARFANHARDGGGLIHMAGSPFWMPPEMIWRAPHGLAVDIWSLGISLWEMAEGKPPNAKNKLKALFTAATEGIAPLARHSVNTGFGDFLAGALTLSPTDRPTAATLEESPFIAEAASVDAMSAVLRSVFMADALQGL